MNRREFTRSIAACAALSLPCTARALPSSADVQPASHRTPALKEFEKLQFGVSFHFSMNTFTGNDYETGGVPASTYNPTNLDVRQWLRVARDLGARYAVLTAKHMSGFCLWDAKDYDYDVAANLGLHAHVPFSGALAWPYFYPWPQRPPGLIEAAFDELAKRWRPILDKFDRVGVNLCFEIHSGEDLHDGVTFEMFLDRLGGHQRCNILFDPSHFVLQQLDYLEFHQPLSRQNQDVSREGRGLPAKRAPRSLRRISTQDYAGRAFPVFG